MKIDKSSGKWCADSNLIDNVAYSLYINYWKEYNKLTYEKYNFAEQCLTQEVFIKHKNDLLSLKEFYDNAIKNIRKEKLEMLNENR